MYNNLKIIVAVDQNMGISKNNKTPWYIPDDLKYFRSVTSCVTDNNKQNCLIMGRKTAVTLNYKLPNRISYIVSSTLSDLDIPDVYVFDSIKKCLEHIYHNDKVDKTFVIGGQDIYNEVMTIYNYLIDEYHITQTETNGHCDRKINLNISKMKHNFNVVNTIGRYNYVTRCFKYKNRQEFQYLDLISKILLEGEIKNNRTGINTYSLFSSRLEFDISTYFPLLTTKKLAFRIILEELLWMIRGQTNNKILKDKNINIWSGNCTKQFLENRSLNYQEDDLGPIYGFQMRHSGANYLDCHTDYSGQGIDQLQKIIDTIKINPDDRRIILMNWNVKDLDKMALPPCHVMAQFYIRQNKYLDCQMYQRSADIGLGVPFNIASYSLLTYIIANITSYKPGRLIHLMGDTHIYSNHVDELKEQTKRSTFMFPRLVINKQLSDLDQIQKEDFELVEYKSHPNIKMQMAV